jgi:CheY-like chemotaxis protein
VRKRILVVDDNDTIVRLISQLLTQNGYEVTYAANGMQAVERLETEPFCLVLSDVFMPEMNGYELLDVVRSRFPSTRVILMTSNLPPKLDLFHRQADHYIEKPFDLEGLLQAIKVLVANPSPQAKLSTISSAEENRPS